MSEEEKRKVRPKKDSAKKFGENGSRDAWGEASSRNIWIAGAGVLVLTVLFCSALLRNSGRSPLPQNVPAMLQGPGDAGMPGQGFAPSYPPPGFLNPHAGCPNFAQCFPQAAGAVQPAALVNPHAGCPSFTQCFPSAPASAGVQPVAFANPHAGCPSFTQCFPQGSVQAVALTNPVMGAAAAAASAPPIFRDAVLPHAFRGVCENCHVVSPDIPISKKAQLPHEFRGVCSNCHTITDLPPGP
jgi:hypothetical protein